MLQQSFIYFWWWLARDILLLFLLLVRLFFDLHLLVLIIIDFLLIGVINMLIWQYLQLLAYSRRLSQLKTVIIPIDVWHLLNHFGIVLISHIFLSTPDIYNLLPDINLLTSLSMIMPSRAVYQLILILWNLYIIQIWWIIIYS